MKPPEPLRHSVPKTGHASINACRFMNTERSGAPPLSGEAGRGGVPQGRRGFLFRHCERSEAKTGAASIKNGSGLIYPARFRCTWNAARFTASSVQKHSHKLRRMFYEHGAERSNLNRMRIKIASSFHSSQ